MRKLFQSNVALSVLKLRNARQAADETNHRAAWNDSNLDDLNFLHCGLNVDEFPLSVVQKSCSRKKICRVVHARTKISVMPPERRKSSSRANKQTNCLIDLFL